MMPRVKVKADETPLDDNLEHKYLDVIRSGELARESGVSSTYSSQSLEHCLHCIGWVYRDLQLALEKATGGRYTASPLTDRASRRSTVRERQEAEPLDPSSKAYREHLQQVRDDAKQQKDEPAWKQDGGKPRIDLVAPEFIVGTAEVLRFGAAKYAERNWEKGMSWGRCYGALMRHLWAWWAGEKNDAETGMSHLHHAACCLMFLVAYEERQIGTDDRKLPVDGVS